MKRIGLPLVAAVATVGLTLTACSSGPPSKDDLTESLVENGELPEDLADCVADALLDSDLSDDQLNAVADDDRSNLDDGDEDDVIAVITEAGATCSAE
jgi:hypothetical protein